jgi:hypothetical protein
MEHVDLDAVGKLVREWLDTHDDGTLSQMTSDLQDHFPAADREDMAVVMRGMMSAELRRRTSPPPGITPDPPVAGDPARNRP